MAIADLRREYNLSGLRRQNLASDPIAQFQAWFGQAMGVRSSGRVMKFLVNLYKSFMMLFGSAPRTLMPWCWPPLTVREGLPLAWSC